MTDRGFVADIGTRLGEVESDDRKKKAIVVYIALALVVASGGGYILSQPSSSHVITIPSIIINTTKEDTLMAGWNEAFYRDPRTPYTDTNETLLYVDGWEHSKVTVFCGIYGFENTITPLAFKNATLKFKVTDFSYYHPNDTQRPEKPPYDNPLLHVSVPIKLSEVDGNWTEWVAKNQVGGVTWADIVSNVLPVNKTAVGTVYIGTKNTTDSWNITLQYNISKVIQKWIAGKWNPSKGFLLSIIAPWEAISAIKFYDYVNNSVIMINVGPGQIIIDGVTFIPEFQMLIIPIVATIAIIFLFRRKERL